MLLSRTEKVRDKQDPVPVKYWFKSSSPHNVRLFNKILYISSLNEDAKTAKFRSEALADSSNYINSRNFMFRFEGTFRGFRS